MSTETCLRCTVCGADSGVGLGIMHARQAIAALIELWPAIAALEEQYDALTPDTWYGLRDLCQAHSLMHFIQEHGDHRDTLVLYDDNGGPETPWQASLHKPADTVTTDASAPREE